MMSGADVTALERTIALAVFAASYVGLGLGRVPGFRVDRTGVAIIGGALMVGFFEYCRVGIPLTVLTLLLGWLILIAVPA
jgi:hypothetical protein